jgi:hypothetical protein
MNPRLLVASLATAGLALAVGQIPATALPGDGGTSDTQAGPDVIVGSIPDVTKYGANTVNGTVIMAYAFGSTSCNLGTQELDWYAGTSNHPVIPQNAYRIKNGRIEQIGVGWMKHGFCALQENLCATCTPAGSGCPSLLGVGCSDPYTASLNGSQGDLGPRYEVNPSTGAFPATGSTTWPSIPSGQSTIGRRVQIKADDLNPSLNAGAVYLAECQYVHPQDAAYGNDNNNASYRQFTVGTLSGGAYNISLAGSTYLQRPAIYYWPAVSQTAVINQTDAPDGRYLLGSNATQNQDGTWHYEIAVYNMNSDAAADSVTINVPYNVTVTNAGFKDVAYHSGEPYNSTDWNITVAPGQVKWKCTETFAQNPNANALRWATLYNFWFDATTGPTTGQAALGMFKTGGTIFGAAKVPADPCRMADFDCNGVVDGADLGRLLQNWGGPGITDIDRNGVTNGADLGITISLWG